MNREGCYGQAMEYAVHQEPIASAALPLAPVEDAAGAAAGVAQPDGGASAGVRHRSHSCHLLLRSAPHVTLLLW